VGWRHNGVVTRKLVGLDPACLNAREDHRSARKNALPITLDEVRSRGPDSKDEVGRFVCIESVEIIHKRSVCFVVGQPGVQERVVMKIHWRLRSARYSQTNELRVVGPGFETKAERVQHQTRFGSTCARLFVEVARTIAAASEAAPILAKRLRSGRAIRQERIAILPRVSDRPERL
jgi:hypothetical protein